MGIFERMGRVASANFNALLDRADSPEKSLELTLHEMREQLRAARRELVRSVAAEKQLGAKVSDLAREITRWEERAELAVRNDKDELARAALAQKRRLTAERDRTEALRIQQLQEALDMKAELERMERKLEDFSARKGTIANEIARAKRGASDPLGGPSGPGGKAFEEFRRMEAKIDTERSEADAMSEVDESLRDGLSATELEAKFAALEGRGHGETPGAKDAIDDELDRLKKKLRIEK